jgi:hypothetical protein
VTYPTPFRPTRRRAALGLGSLALLGGLALAPPSMASSSQNGADMVVINPGGGRLANGSDGLQSVINGNDGFRPLGAPQPGQSVPEDGSDQHYFANTGQWCCGGVSPQLNIGGQLVGEAGASRNTSAQSWSAVEIVETTGSAVRTAAASNALPSTPTGDGSARIRHTTVQGGLTYVMERSISYTYPNPYYTESYAFTVPAGNAAPVKFYIGGDAAPGDDDQGRGVTVSSPRRVAYEVNENSGIFVAYGEIEGSTPFSNWFVGDYSDPYSDIAAGNDLSDTADTSSHDAGIDVQWTIPSTPGTYTRAMQTIVNFQATGITAGFPTTTIAAGQSAPLEFQIVNTLFAPATGLGFTLALPAGLTVSGAPTNSCGGTATGASGATSVALSGASVSAAGNCTLSVPVTGAAGAYTVNEQDLVVTGSLTKGFGASTLTVAGPATPAPPTAPAPAPAAPAPSGPASFIAPLEASVGTGAANRGQARTVARVELEDTGRYTFIYTNRSTGKRLTQLPGSALGKRTLAKRYSAPVLRNQTPGRRIVLRTYFAKTALAAGSSDVVIRVIRKAPDGTLSEVTIDAQGGLVG